VSYSIDLTYKLQRDDDSELVLDLAVKGTWSMPGSTSGPFESSYPPEGGEIEEVTATCDGEPFDLDSLSKAENDKVMTFVDENAELEAAEKYSDAAQDYDPTHDFD